ncbi:uncharacterized protein TOT_040000022 [Theileria orientalis strain Shintoku]|uniref:ABC transporter n=1 Tax=Theileria orientalis strain Shintoku TaxID=869250 RepID=J4C464_THEOR|nr:uncharacterized protein TOT_040000022 [Theileria orientalis strain Shintoku]BAM41641.1 uncharacterized protein TOT_040000022 [Theileria orientalis strain Shintoku]|eukprot:XP_009691942.1 uncharacterized protein TOT_040000022 [Theileria orientalis strain Shintoku]
MNGSSNSKDSSHEDGPESCFWESFLYSKSYFTKLKHKKFRYYDNSNIFKYLFFHWVSRWVYLLSKRYVEPYKYHPLPISDQVLKWQPIFSKHVSDGIVRLDSYHYSKSQSRDTKAKKPYSSILLRALFLTIWKRALVVIIGLVLVNVLSMSISILVKRLVVKLGDNSLICIVNYLYVIGIFQHGLSHRRKFSNNIDGSNSLNVCNQVIHSCSPDSECSKNPLYCPARRYQSKDINGQIFNFVYNDSFYVSQSIEALKYIIEFMTNFGYGVYLLSLQVKVNIWVLYFLGIFFVFIMVVVEILSAITIKFVLHYRDYRLTKSNDIVSSLALVKKMFYDDIAINIITKSRNNELSVLFVNMFLTYFNMTLYNMCIIITFYMVQRYFVASVIDASVITDIDTAGFMTSFYIFLRIAISMFLLPKCIRSIAKSYVSFKRMGIYIKDCSPNFYISDNICTGSVQTCTNITYLANQRLRDVVYYKDATFTWVNTRDDLLNKNYEPLLKNVNFQLKRSEIAIVTGSKGSGKSNFIKSMLGEMTLVGGSMAVVPLHTSMPIFYASEDIFLQHGTVRSNIVFGHRFDENLYKTVLSAVELEYDISTWEKGDLRLLSDNAPSLSGGQRVRMELARAVYAYLVFHQVNKEYNDCQCSFLMCLDASFHGLDPYVSKTIFNNLFNVKTGLLVKDDLSVVLTTSKQTLDICSKMSDINQVPNPPVYNINNQMLKFYLNLHDFIKNKRVNNIDNNYISHNIGSYMSYLTYDMLSLCSSGANTRLRRIKLTRSKYSKSFKSYARDELAGVKFNPYKVYLMPSLGFFVIYLLINIIVSVMDNIKYVLSTRLSDYISKHIRDFKNGQYFDLAEIKAHSTFWLRIMTLFVSVIIVLTILSTILFSILSNITCRKIHEYVVDSIFKNSSSVIKVKKQINQVMTYLSCDTTMTDEDVGYILLLFLTCSIQAITNIVTLFYLIPISIPFFIVSLSILFKFILLNLINCAKNKQIAMLESMSQVNSVCENAISGSSIYRSYKNELSLVINLIENIDYKVRSRFLYRLILTWCALIFKYVFSATTLIVLVLPIILDRFTKYKMKVGYFGLALSLCMNLAKSFSKFSTTYAKLEIYSCSLQRFQYFIPPKKTLQFSSFVNTHEEYVVIPDNKAHVKFQRDQLLIRRAFEFKAENKRFYKLRKFFYDPKLTIIDAGDYLPYEHSDVLLNDVCVYTTADHNPESMLLNHFNASAHRSEIIGIVGRTGAGKTILLCVLQNIMANRTGHVILDGKDLNDIPKVVLRQIIGVLPQLPFVFKGWTVRRFLDPRKLFSDADINQALNKCALLNFVNELPGGKKLDTILVKEDLRYSSHNSKKGEIDMNFKSNHESLESNVILSNTQLRTLSLARLVLYRHFYRMILVDEPPEEDLVAGASGRQDDLGVPIYDLLQKHFSHCTTFVAAHDANVLKTCTSVWVIHDGCLVRTCKTSDIAANESVARIIEECLKQF